LTGREVSRAAATTPDARCDDDLYPDTGGCAARADCVLAERTLHPETSKYVCWPTPLTVE
jgi:hypothetical protein